MQRDRIANEKIIDFFVPLSRTNGTHQSGVFDLRQGPSGEGPGREIPTNILFMLQIGALFGTGATIVCTVYTGDTAAGVTLYGTVAGMSQAEGQNLYLFEVSDLQRYIEVYMVLSGNTLCNMLGSANRSRREPVLQLGTEKAVTYAKSPATA